MDQTRLTTLSAAEVLASLNKALLAERQAAFDYAAHAEASMQLHLREALEALCDVEKEHAHRVSERVMALGGSPADVALDTTPLPADARLESRLTHDLIGEQWAIVEYARMVAYIVDDAETVELMVELLKDEIRHARWLKSTLQALPIPEA